MENGYLPAQCFFLLLVCFILQFLYTFVLTICNPFIFGVAYTCFTFIEDVYVVPHKFIEFVKINIRQNRTYYASLRCSDIGIFVLPLFHVACFEEFTYQSQETLVIDSFSKDSD